jgi:hypothetical protein
MLCDADSQCAGAVARIESANRKNLSLQRWFVSLIIKGRCKCHVGPQQSLCSA